MKNDENGENDEEEDDEYGREKIYENVKFNYLPTPYFDNEENDKVILLDFNTKENKALAINAKVASISKNEVDIYCFNNKTGKYDTEPKTICLNSLKHKNYQLIKQPDEDISKGFKGYIHDYNIGNINSYYLLDFDPRVYNKEIDSIIHPRPLEIYRRHNKLEQYYSLNDLEKLLTSYDIDINSLEFSHYKIYDRILRYNTNSKGYNWWESIKELRSDLESKNDEVNKSEYERNENAECYKNKLKKSDQIIKVLKELREEYNKLINDFLAKNMENNEIYRRILDNDNPENIPLNIFEKPQSTSKCYFCFLICTFLWN